MTPPRHVLQRSCRAFSLAEVVIAMAVVGVGILPLVGLMGTGLDTVRSSNAEVRAAIIARRLVAQAQMSAYGQLPAQTTRHFDIEGREVTSGQGVFKAVVTIAKGDLGGAITSPNGARLSVTLSGPALHGQEKIFSCQLANHGF